MYSSNMKYYYQQNYQKCKWTKAINTDEVGYKTISTFYTVLLNDELISYTNISYVCSTPDAGNEVLPGLKDEIKRQEPSGPEKWERDRFRELDRTLPPPNFEISYKDLEDAADEMLVFPVSSLYD